MLCAVVAQGRGPQRELASQRFLRYGVRRTASVSASGSSGDVRRTRTEGTPRRPASGRGQTGGRPCRRSSLRQGAQPRGLGGSPSFPVQWTRRVEEQGALRSGGCKLVVAQPLPAIPWLFILSSNEEIAQLLERIGFSAGLCLRPQPFGFTAVDLEGFAARDGEMVLSSFSTAFHRCWRNPLCGRWCRSWPRTKASRGPARITRLLIPARKSIGSR